jgi:hypothetical protein
VSIVAAGILLGVATPAHAGTTTTMAVSPATDRATAQRINLTAADLPGWQKTPSSSNTSNPDFDATMSACVGMSLKDEVSVSSPNFSQGSTQINSNVSMVRSRAQGLADLRALKSSRVPSCLKKAMTSTSMGLPKGTRVSKLKVSSFTPTESLPNSFGLRIAMTISQTNQGIIVSVPLTATEIGFLVGRTEVSLGEIWKAQAGPPSVEPALLRTLLARAGGSVSA